MPARSLQQAKRSFVTVLLTIAALDSVRLMVSRDPSDEDCANSFKRVSPKARHNRGGFLAHLQPLNATKETSDKARRNNTRNREGPKMRGSSDAAATQTQRPASASRAASQKGQSVAKSQANSLRKVCSALVEKHGAAKGYQRTWATLRLFSCFFIVAL